MTEVSDKKLGCVRAVIKALLDRPLSYFPRVEEKRSGKQKLRSLDDKEAIQAIISEINYLTPQDHGLDDALKIARESLDEVTAQTEYQDGKATRLLTILTFMSAFSGFAFNRLADNYPLSMVNWSARWEIATSSLLIASYVLFAAFALLATSGALVTFHAIRSRFRYPKPAADGKRVESLLFWIPISRTQPSMWAKAFVDPTDPSKISPGLKLEYLKNYIVETYLIAAKVADKVRFLEPAQRLQSLALKALFFWIIITVVVFAFVPPAKKESNSVILMETPVSAVRVTGGSNVSTAAKGQTRGNLR